MVACILHLPVVAKPYKSQHDASHWVNDAVWPCAIPFCIFLVKAESTSEIEAIFKTHMHSLCWHPSYFHIRCSIYHTQDLDSVSMSAVTLEILRVSLWSQWSSEGTFCESRQECRVPEFSTEYGDIFRRVSIWRLFLLSTGIACAVPLP